MRQGNKYVSCSSCNITSVTTWNVTYGCYEISKICPATTTNARKMWYLKGGKGGGGSTGSTGRHWDREWGWGCYGREIPIAMEAESFAAQFVGVVTFDPARWCRWALTCSACSRSWRSY